MWKPGGLRRVMAENREEFEEIIQESSTYKIKMENILCKTDIKNEQLVILKLITQNSSMLNNVRYRLGIDDHKQYIDDDERYLKMMMKLDPNDSDVLESYGHHLLHRQRANHLED